MTVSGKARRAFLQETFERFHHAEYISPDPLQFVYLYDDPLDREIVGLIASALAYGRVAQVLKSVGLVLDKMGPSPRCFLEETEESGLMERFSGFRHRFTTGRELAELLTGIRRVILSLIHISEPTRLLSISYAVFCLKKKKHQTQKTQTTTPLHQTTT